MNSDDRPFDEGLQLERTALSWQRTLLCLVVASLAAGRGLAPLVGNLSWLAASLGVGMSIVAFVVARRRYVSAHKHLTAVDPYSLPAGGALVAATALIGFGTGLGALAFVVHHGL